jgi:hypothetical protein
MFECCWQVVLANPNHFILICSFEVCQDYFAPTIRVHLDLNML